MEERNSLICPLISTRSYETILDHSVNLKILHINQDLIMINLTHKVEEQLYVYVVYGSCEFNVRLLNLGCFTLLSCTRSFHLSLSQLELVGHLHEGVLLELEWNSFQHSHGV